MKMNMRLDAVILIFAIAKVRSKEPELPLCPTNMPFFPQNLPMHCRMPPGGFFHSEPAAQNPTNMITFPPDFFKSPSPDKSPNPIPFPIPPGFPGFPGLPPGMPGPMPGPMPMPVPMPPPGPAHKLPVIVMPFYSPDPSYKKRQSSHGHHRGNKRIVRVYGDNRRHMHYPEGSAEAYRDIGAEFHPRRSSHRRDAEDFDNSPESFRDSSEEGRRGPRRTGRQMNRYHKSSRRRHRNKQELLTPILQYVTKDGYVIFEKKISKNEAKDWLKKDERESKDEPEIAEVQKNNELGEFNEMNPEVEILDVLKNKNVEQNQEKAKEASIRTPKKYHPHRSRGHHTKTEKEEVPM